MSNGGGTRARLLEEAIRVIEAEGEAGVRIRDVSASAGVSFASLYHFFGDRDGLVEAAQAERYRRILVGPIPALRESVLGCRSKADLREVLLAAARSLYVPERAVNRATRIEITGIARNRPRLTALVSDANAAAFADLADALRPAQVRGWIRADLDLVAFAAWFTTQNFGRWIVEMDPAGSIDLATWDRISIDAALAVLLGERPGRA